MTTSIHQIQEQKLIAYSSEIEAIATAATLPLTHVELWIRTMYLLYLCHRTLSSLDAMEKSECTGCQGCAFPVQGQLRSARNGLRLILDHKVSIPRIFYSRVESVVSRFDDKLENYALAADPEIKDMMAELVRRRHAAH